MPGGMDSERTSELAYPAKLLQIRWSRREKLAMPAGMDRNLTSKLAYPAKLLQIRWFLRERS